MDLHRLRGLDVRTPTTPVYHKSGPAGDIKVNGCWCSGRPIAESTSGGPACIAARLTAYAASMNEPKVDQLTASQRDALAAELAELEGPKRTAAVEAIKTAREHGDLSENFEYHAAKDEQGLLEARIRTLRSRLDHSVLVDESELAPDKVGVGSTVEIEDDQGNRLQGEISSLGGNGAISPDSPLGRALIGRCQGEAVEVEAPRGRWTARILSIRRT